MFKIKDSHDIVYIVTWYDGYEESGIVEVYKDRDKAQACVEDCNENCDSGLSYSCESFIVVE